MALPCKHPRCTLMATQGAYCATHKPKGRTRGRPIYSYLYTTSRWNRIKKTHLSSHPLCVRCNYFGLTSAATDVDHIIPHKGDEEMFFSSPLQSLCHSCHSYKTGQERKGVYLDWSNGTETRHEKP